MQPVEGSVKRLRTDYIDLYWVLTEAIRFWIPKLPIQSQAGENLSHLVRLRTPRILLQSG
jgi:aryl-alcohol dehydrogenase-like predicted oxidoreductase